MYSRAEWPAIGGTTENRAGESLRRGPRHSAGGEDCFGCGIDLAEGGVAGIQSSDGGGLRGDARGDADSAGAGGFDRGPQATADACEQGGAVGRAFLGFNNFDGVAVDVGLDLPPQGRERASTTEADAGNGHIHFAEKSERVAEAEGDAFENGANDMSASVRSSKSNKRAACVRIKMRGTLAHQIRRPQEAVGTGGNFGGFGGELVVGFAGTAGICCKRIAEPAQGEACSLRDSHDVPASRNGVAKSMDAAVRIERGAIRDGK